MKPASFKYFAPTSVEETLAHLAEHGWDAKVLAGGQSLIPMMNFRLAQPEILIDINNLSELSNINSDDNGGLLIGSMVRHYQVEHSPLVAERTPLIYETMPQIATSQIRSRGTFGGSIAHADPSAELPAVSVALEGRYRLQSQSGDRWVPANEFFVGMYTTQLEPEELLVEVEIPPQKPNTGWALVEVARRLHDFALVGAAAVVRLNDKDECEDAKLVLFSVGEGPMEAHKAVDVMIGQKLDQDVIREAAEVASSEDIDPSSDIHATAKFRRHLAGVLSHRAIEQAVGRIGSKGKPNKSQKKKRK